ncbi:DASS family sodium-coupled anion symporter [Anaerovibrio slackiae]|uniref:DASS family sodium-coupled anion symporter n=1 Tax=Anaerovibrio slackiae TaxID=2652309 RepID=UPI003868E2E9
MICMRQKYGLAVAILVLIATLMVPTPPELSTAGHRMLAVLLFSVIVWMSESVSYPVSASIIMTLMAFLLGTAPNMNNPDKMLGTSGALKLALSGFSSTALALVGAALFIAAAMMKTGLDKRIALFVLSKIGARTNRILAGVILVGFILSFFVPSTTARVSCMVPIVMGIISAFGVPLKSRFSAVMMIAIAQADSIWNVGIKTAAAQNMVALGFIEKQLGTTISWLDWFIAAAPFAVIMSVVLYFLLLKLVPPEMKEIPGGQETVARALRELGPMTASEKKLMALSVILLFLWSTEKVLHSFDTSTTTLAAVTLMMLPGIGIMDWKEAQNRIGWGTLVMFGVGISLGSAILSTKAATWIAHVIVDGFSLYTMSAVAIIGVMSLFLILIHLGFASATALSSAMIPIIISVLQGASEHAPLNVVGMTMILQYVMCFGFILPVNAPQNMVAFSTETFEARTFVKTGIPLTIIAFGVIMLMSVTYWSWLGII